MPPLLTTQTQFFSSAYLMKIQSSYGTLGFMFQRLGGHFATSIDLNLNIGDISFFDSATAELTLGQMAHGVHSDIACQPPEEKSSGC